MMPMTGHTSMLPGDLRFCPSSGAFRKVLIQRSPLADGICLDFSIGQFATGRLRRFTSQDPDHGSWQPSRDAAAEQFLLRWIFGRKTGAEAKLLKALEGWVGDSILQRLKQDNPFGFAIVHAILNANAALSSLLDSGLQDGHLREWSPERLRQAIRDNPHYHLPHVLLGNITLKQGLFGEAARWYEAASGLHSDEGFVGVTLHNNWGYAEVSLGMDQLRRKQPALAVPHLSRAVVSFTQALRLHEDLEIFNNLTVAEIYRRRALANSSPQLPSAKRDEFRSALEVAEALGTRWPNSDLKCLALGVTHCELSRLSLLATDAPAAEEHAVEAQLQFEQAVSSIELGGDIAAIANYNLGALLATTPCVRVREPATGLRLLQKAGSVLQASSRPVPADFKRLLLRIYAEAGTRSDPQLLETFADTNDPETLLKAVRGHIDRGEFDDAVGLAEVILEFDERNSEANSLAATALSAIGREDEAASRYEIAFDERPAAYYAFALRLAERDAAERRFARAIDRLRLGARYAPAGPARDAFSTAMNQIMSRHCEALFTPVFLKSLTKHGQGVLECVKNAEAEYLRLTVDQGSSPMPAFMLLTLAAETGFQTLIVGPLIAALKHSGLPRGFPFLIGHSSNTEALEKITIGRWKDLLRGGLRGGGTVPKDNSIADEVVKQFISGLRANTVRGQTLPEYLCSCLFDTLPGLTTSFHTLRNIVFHPDASTFQSVSMTDIQSVREQLLDVTGEAWRKDRSAPSFFEALTMAS